MELLNVELEQEVELQTSYELSGGIIPTGTINITTNGIHDVSSYADANVNVQGGVTPTGTKEIVVDNAGVITEDISSYANVEITVPQGQYKPQLSTTMTPSISVSNGGLITASNTTQRLNDFLLESFVEGYVTNTDVSAKATITGGSATQQLSTQGATTITPSTSQQTAVASGKYTTGNVLVAPIPSQYIIPTGTKQITANGTGIDVSEYEFVDVNVSGGGGSGVATGTFTPSARVNTISFDVGTTSTISHLLIVPTSETPLKSGGKTIIAVISDSSAFYKYIGVTSNNSGAGFLYPTYDLSNTKFTQTGSTITVTPTNAGSFETISYTWYAW